MLLPNSPDASESASSQSSLAVHLERITKRFPGVTANDDVTLRVRRGAFHAVIGENGAGKSTLLNILYGRYRPDEGCVHVNGVDVTARLRGPSDAISLGIGLVSQHYALIPALSVLENVILGSEPLIAGMALDLKSARTRIKQLADQLGLQKLEPGARADQLSVADQQKVEILKALYRNAGILLLDEPTATLAPQEADALFALLQSLNHQGTTIVFVTHKLREVMANSTEVSVLRAGRNAGDFTTVGTNAGELLGRMIGPRTPNSRIAVDAVLSDAKTAAAIVTGSPLLRISGVSIRNTRGVLAVDRAEFTLNSGEILGVAGVDGSGQRELSEAIVGLRSIEPREGSMSLESDKGTILIDGLSVRRREELGIAYIPEDRHRSAMIGDFTIAENYLLGHETKVDWGGGAVLKPGVLLRKANTMIGQYDVRMGSRDAGATAGELSGGNQQKVVVARALDSNPKLLVACQPTRGLDPEAAGFVYSALRSAAEKGLGVLLFSLDLDEILELSHRIAVMYNGKVVGVLHRSEATADRIGQLMTTGTEIAAA